MKDVFLPLRKAYYAKLAAPLLAVGATLHDAVPTGTPAPYVHFLAQNAETITSTRGCEIIEAQVQLEIVAAYTHTQGRKPVDIIAEAIYAALETALPPQPGLDIGLAYMESDFDRGRQETDTASVNTRIIRFTHIVTFT